MSRRGTGELRACVLALGMALVPAFSALGLGAGLTASLEPKEIALGESATLTVTVTGDSAAPRVPQVDGLEIQDAGRSTQIQIVNGSVSRSTSFLYEVRPLRAGSFTLPPVELDAAAGALSTGALALQVLPSGSAPRAVPTPEGRCPGRALAGDRPPCRGSLRGPARAGGDPAAGARGRSHHRARAAEALGPGLYHQSPRLGAAARRAHHPERRPDVDLPLVGRRLRREAGSADAERGDRRQPGAAHGPAPGAAEPLRRRLLRRLPAGALLRPRASAAVSRRESARDAGGGGAARGGQAGRLQRRRGAVLALGPREPPAHGGGRSRDPHAACRRPRELRPRTAAGPRERPRLQDLHAFVAFRGRRSRRATRAGRSSSRSSSPSGPMPTPCRSSASATSIRRSAAT